MYFIPASFASFTHSSALNFTGLKRDASCSYSLTGTRERSITHSPSPGERLPFHSPAGIAYNPQWMKRPYLASRNHSSRFSRAGSGGLGACAQRCETMHVTAAQVATVCFIRPVLFDLPVRHPGARDVILCFAGKVKPL